jgi:PilZ domain
MQVKTIRLNAQGHGVLGCDQCGTTKVVPLAEGQHLGKRLKIKCRCGHSFVVSIEARRFYRKKTHLPGAYAKTTSARGVVLEQGPMTVEDVSRTGLRLRLSPSHTLRVHESIEVRFHLDNAQRAAVRRQARVVWVDGACVGAAWVDSEDFNATNRLLGMYLMSE